MIRSTTRRPLGRAPVLLAGAFGQGNPGDEALLDAFRRALDDLPLVIASTDPAETEQRHGLPAISSRSWRDVTRVVSNSAGVVFAGGTVFKNLVADTGRARTALLRNALAVAAFGRAVGVPVCMTGVGVGDISGFASRALARQLARHADLLVLRDAPSARALARVGVPAPLRVGADPAWTLLDQVPADRDEDSDVVVVVPSVWAAATSPRLIDVLVDSLQRLIDVGCTIHVQPWQSDVRGVDDRRFAEAIAGGLVGDVTVVPPPESLEDAAHAFTSARLVISARFHALVAAGAAGTPFIALAHEHKQRAIADRLGQPTLWAQATPAHARAVMQDALSVAPPAHAAVRAEIAAAEEAFGLLRLVLSGGEMSAESISGLHLEPAW